MKITNTMQQVAADILEEIDIACMSNNEMPQWLSDLYDEVFKKYELCRDPFTRLPCTTKEYYTNSLEYEQQTMDLTYGHHDGLEE